MRIIYMGTPDIAVPAFEALVESEHEVIAAITQPDRSKGRHKDLIACPVKEAALKHGIPVLQPEKARDTSFIDEIKELNPDLIVVMAYGQILTKEFLEVPKYGCINIHASLLPKYRGAAPISAVIAAGESETGITTMYMDEGLDTGDMLLKTVISIEEKETTETLEEKIALAGGPLIIETIEKLLDGSLERIKQNEAEATYIPMIKKEEGHINWDESAEIIERKTRAFYPWPGTYAMHNGSRIKVYSADITEDSSDETGKILSISSEGIKVSCKEGSLIITDLQAEGKKRMPVADFIRGYKITEGERLS